MQKHTKLSFILFILGITLIAIYTLKDSLLLALTGDDWLLLYTIKQAFEIRKSMGFLEPRAYLCTYCPPHAYLSLIKHFWGYNPFYYYLTSLVVKIVSSVALFTFVKNLTKNTLIATLASIFFVTSYIGIQTTDWVFNLNHYAGVGTAAIFLLFYFKLKDQLNFKNILATSLLFATCLIISPPRMHGLLPLVITLEGIWWILEKKSFSLKSAILRITLLAVTYKLVFASGGYGTQGYLQTIIDNFYSHMESLQKGNSEFLLNPIATLGNYLLPDKLYAVIPFEDFVYLNKLPFTFFTFIVPIFIVFWVFTSFVLITSGASYKMLMGYFGLGSIWSAVVRFIKTANLASIGNEKVAYILIGGLMLIFSLFLFTAIKKKQLSTGILLLIGLLWMLTFTLFPWLLSPDTILESWARYSVQQSAGLAIWAACIFSVLLNAALSSKRKISFAISIFLTLTFTFIHISFTKSYITNLVTHRSEEKVEKVWSKIISDVPQIDKDAISIFYISYDDYYLAEWGLRFGFSSRAAMHYNIIDQKNNPYIILNYDDLVSIATDGEAMTKLGHTPQTIPLTRIFAFDLKDGTLTNTTSETRKKLVSHLK